jgi:hypothetical protein
MSFYLPFWKLMTVETQYFITGATRKAGADDDIIVKETDWFGCSNTSIPGGLCEVRLNCFPEFVSSSLTK